MRNDLGTALSVLSEKTSDNTKSIRRNNLQRRDEFVDLYGIEFHRNGSADSPAVFHVSVSGDAAYMERFQFKLVIEPFQVSSELALTSTSLSITDDDNITPNPHNHQLVAGVTNIPVTASDFTIEVEGIDITPYLRAQVEEGGWDWFSGEGVYPSSNLEESFDLMEVASDIEAEGGDGSKILRQGWKPITLRGSQPFSATLVLYLKYQHMNR